VVTYINYLDFDTKKLIFKLVSKQQNKIHNIIK